MGDIDKDKKAAAEKERQKQIAAQNKLMAERMEARQQKEKEDRQKAASSSKTTTTAATIAAKEPQQQPQQQQQQQQQIKIQGPNYDINEETRNEAMLDAEQRNYAKKLAEVTAMINELSDEYNNTGATIDASKLESHQQELAKIMKKTESFSFTSCITQMAKLSKYNKMDLDNKSGDDAAKDHKDWTLAIYSLNRAVTILSDADTEDKPKKMAELHETLSTVMARKNERRQEQRQSLGGGGQQQPQHPLQPGGGGEQNQPPKIIVVELSAERKALARALQAYIDARTTNLDKKGGSTSFWLSSRNKNRKLNVAVAEELLKQVNNTKIPSKDILKDVIKLGAGKLRGFAAYTAYNNTGVGTYIPAVAQKQYLQKDLPPHQIRGDLNDIIRKIRDLPKAEEKAAKKSTIKQKNQ